MMVTYQYDACVPWAPNMGCCPDWDDHPTELQDRAVALAWAAMRFLSAGMLGSCEVHLRPCAARLCNSCWDQWHLSPYLRDGNWYNGYRCGNDGCSCGAVSEVLLSGKVAEISEVFLYGEVMPPTSYRLDDGRRLVRVDGESWPHCQNMNLPNDHVDAFTVSYVPGVKPDAAGLWAVGVLACEFAKACTGAKCRLPSSVTSMTRQGVSYEFDNSMFSNGQTGIREVDAYVLSINPNRLKVPPRVWSPDQHEVRYTPTPTVDSRHGS